MELRPLCVMLLLLGLIHCILTEKPKPVITSNLKGAALTGNSVTLTCTLTPQSTGWKFYWEKDSQYKTETDTHIYTFSPSSVYDRGQYRCRAGRGKTEYYTHPSNELWVDVTESPKPVVIINPDTQVYSGETVTFRCNIQTRGGTEWTYSWYRDGATFYPYSTAQELIISSVRDSDGVKYTCRGRRRDSQLSQISDAVTLSVSEKPRPVIRSSHKGETLTGNSVTLTCTLNLQTADWKFYWIKDTQSTRTETFHWTIRSVSVSDGGQYWCRAGRRDRVYYTDYSDALWVNVIEIKPVLIINPDTQVFRGETVTFRCNIQTGGDTEWTYSWYKNENTQTPYSRTQEFTVNIPEQDRSYYGGKHTCRGTRRSDSQISKTSEAVTLSVSEKPKPELTSDINGAALTGNPVTLTCRLKLRSAGWKFYWIKDTQSTETETFHWIIRSVSVDDEGQYRCRAGRGNPVYYTQYSDALWVNVTDESPPMSLIISPSRTQHFTADSLSLSCEDQRDSTGWTVRGHTHSETLYNCSSVSGSTCNISSLSTSHTGVYWCQSESGGRSNSLNITVHNGDVILESPVHPVTEGNPLTLHCLYRNTSISDSGADFYKDDSVLQKQTTGEMTISSVSKSDEGFYHCTHPERGESPKSWLSVRVSAFGFIYVIIALSLAFALFFLMILLIVLVRSKKKKGVEYQTPSAVIQDTSQPADGENVYENTDTKTTDAAAEPGNVTYAEIELKKIKKPKKKPGKSSKGDETVYSELKQDTDKDDAVAGPSDVTYAEIVLKKLKKPKKKPGKSSKGDETVYSELKQDTDKGKRNEGDDNLYSEVKKNPNKVDAVPGPVPDAPPVPSDVTCVKPELIKLKDPKENQGKSSEGDGNLYSEVKKNTDKDVVPGPSDVTCVKPELIKLTDPKENPGKSSGGDGNLYSEVKKKTDKDAVPGPPPLPSDLTCVKPELIKLKDPKKNQGVAPGPSDATCVKPEVMKKPKKNQDAAPGPRNVPKTELKKQNPGKSSDGAGDMFSELKRAMEKKSQMSSLKK